MPPQRYSCKECPKSYPNMSGLKRHNKIHTGEPHYCSICKKGFPTEFEQRTHRKICVKTVKTVTYECKGCGNAFIRKSDLSCHVRSCNRKYQPSRSNRENTVKKQDTNPDNVIYCQFCKKKFTDFEEWKKHEEDESAKVGLSVNNYMNSMFGDLEEDLYENTPLVIDIESKKDEQIVSNKKSFSKDAEILEINDDEPFVMDIDMEPNEEAKTSKKTNVIKENPVFETQLISAVKALDASNTVDTSKKVKDDNNVKSTSNVKNTENVDGWNHLSKLIAKKIEASHKSLQEENEPKTSTANLPDSIKDKLKEIEDVASKMDTCKEDTVEEEEDLENTSNSNDIGYSQSNIRDSGNSQSILHVKDPDSDNNMQDKASYQCKECNKRYESIILLEDHNISIHKRKFFCYTCLKGFKEPSNLVRHKEGRDHRFQEKNKLNTGRVPSLEQNNSLKTLPASESKSKFSKDQLQVLTTYFDKHKNLQKQDEIEICQKTKLPLKSVKMWFINKRRYEGKSVLDQSSNDNTKMDLLSQAISTSQLHIPDTQIEKIDFTKSQDKATKQLLSEITNSNKTHYCDTCHQDFFDKRNLTNHMNTPSHKAKLRKKSTVNPIQDSPASQNTHQWSPLKTGNDIQNINNIASIPEHSYQQNMKVVESSEDSKIEVDTPQSKNENNDIIESPPSPGPEIISEIPRYNNPMSSYSPQPPSEMNMLQEKARRYDTMQALKPMFGVMMQQMSAMCQTLFQNTSGLPGIQQTDQFGRPIQQQNSFNNGFNGYPGTFTPVTYDANTGYPTAPTPGYPGTSWNTTPQFNNSYCPTPIPSMNQPNNGYSSTPFPPTNPPSYSNYGQQYGELPQTSSRVVYNTVAPDKPVYSDPKKHAFNNTVANTDVEVLQCDSTTDTEVSKSNSVVSGDAKLPQTPAPEMQPQSLESMHPSAFSSPAAVNTKSEGSDAPMDLSKK